ncbi:MAG: hypothetical protein LC753_01720 [Acidobacteria bacterium]|nr:hypothetical protein [Acidobacteriota bacterium]MCA1649025.1 hypothetical protein [Acidobacteriota bacterium]
MSCGTAWRLAGVTALLAAAGVVCAAAMQPPASRPQDLPVTRLDGGALSIPPSPQGQPPGPGQLPPLPMTQLDDRLRQADLDATRAVSVTFSTPLPVRDVLFLLVRGTPFSIVAAAAVSGTFIGELKDLTLRQALETVLFPLGFDYDVEGTIIRVYPRRARTRLFELDYLNVRRAWSRGVRGTVSVGDGPVAAEMSSSTQADTLGELSAAVQAMLSPTGRYHVDRKTGLVQVTDFAERLDQIAVYLETAQLRANRQVRLQARVFELTLPSGAESSIDWAALASRAGTGVRAIAGSAGLKVDDFDALMRAIAARGTIRMIAAPHVLALNNEPAIVRAGAQDVHFVQGGDAGESSHPRMTTEGLTLTVTPQITADGVVQLSISPTYAQKSGQAKSADGVVAPVFTVSETDTLVRVQEGETIVISSLLQERARSKPAGGFSGFFGAVSSEIVRTELIILLTPTVVGRTSSAFESAR